MNRAYIDEITIRDEQNHASYIRPLKINFVRMNRFIFSALTFILVCITAGYGQKPTVKTNDPVRFKLPYDRMMQPAGTPVYFGDSMLENHALDCALSPNGKWLAVEERYSVVFISTATNKVVTTLKLNDSKKLYGSMSTYSGICWYSHNGNQYVLWSAVNNKHLSFVILAQWKEPAATFNRVFTYKPVAPAKTALPNEILIRNESGRDYLYVVLNGNNQLVKQDLHTGDTLWIAGMGVAPYGICQAHGKLYVTNWGGRIPQAGDRNVAGVPWGEARIDPSNAAVREGSVSVVNPHTGKVSSEIVVGLHPNEIISSPDGRYVYLTNSNSDKISVINTSQDQVSETISTRLQEQMNPFFGDSPDGLALSKNGSILYVANGMDNALAVVKLGNKASAHGKKGKSTVEGFIPTQAYPSSISILNNRYLYVTNLEAEDLSIPMVPKHFHTVAYNSHHKMATVSVIKVPGKKQLENYTRTVIAVNQLSRLKTAQLAPRNDVSPRAVPERIGEPSPIKHVLYIIKENRTYDQILGDMKEGNGDSSLCVFGKDITPNTHELAKEYVLLDNFMVSGKCSAEGHQWTDASIVTDYIEKNVRGWFRSYPHIQTDALVYAPSGFLWDDAMSHHKTVRIYGEACTSVFDKSQSWTSIYNDYMKGNTFHFHNVTTLNTIQHVISQTYPGFDHKIPDVLKAQAFIHDLNRMNATPGDDMPNLMIMALPNDHTTGTRPGYPTPRAQVADNDLALGRIVDAVSGSKFWKSTVIFVVEDDSQDGWDHVSPYRTVALVISPYTRMHKTVHQYYDQPSMVRTIEQILGMPPMNIQDAIAPPMFSCFTNHPDFTPYKVRQNRIPLDEMNPALSSLHGKTLYYAKMSLTSQYNGLDSGNDDLLNHILWNAAHHDRPYPQKLAGKDDQN